MKNPQTDYSQLRQLLRFAPSFMAVVRGPEHVFELINDAYMQLVGHRDLTGLPVREALPEIAGQGFFELLDNVYTTGKPYVGHDVEINLQRVSGGSIERAYLNFVYQPMVGASGHVEGIFVEGHDVTEQMKAQIDAQGATMRVRLALEAAEIGIWEADIRNGKLASIRGDDRARELMGAFGDVEESEEVMPFRVAREDRAALSEALRGALDPDTEEYLDIEYRVHDTASEPRWLHLRALNDETALLPKIVGTVRDVTEHKKGDERQAILRNELAHRIKNTLAVVNAIAAQTFKGTDLRAMRKSFTGRITALAEAQNLLIGNTQQSVTLGALTRSAVLPHADVSRFRIEGPEIILGPKQAVAFALAAHELATNAVKYGALSNDTGIVDIDWRVGSPDISEMESRTFVWNWRESGGPPVTQPDRRGFGSTLVGPVLEAEIGGTVRIEYLPGGVVYQATTSTELLQPPAADQ